MARVLSLADHRAARAARDLPRPRVTFAFDLASPWTYLAAERVDRLFTGVHWRPAFGDDLGGASPGGGGLARDRHARGARCGRASCGRAAAARSSGRTTRPTAARPCASPRLAAERERAAPFVLAAGRLTFCGGYDLDDPETLAEAAAAAGLGLDEALEAAADHGARRRAGGAPPGGCWRAGPTPCPRCRSGARSSAASTASPRRPPRRARSRARGRSRADRGAARGHNAGMTRLFELGYRKLGRWYVVLAIPAVMSLTFLVALGGVALLALYADLSGPQFGRIVAVAEALVARRACSSACGSPSGGCAPATPWLRGERTPETAARRVADAAAPAARPHPRPARWRWPSSTITRRRAVHRLGARASRCCRPCSA